MGLQPPLHNILWQVRNLFLLWIYHIIHLFQYLTGTLIIPGFLVNKLFMVYHNSRLFLYWIPGFGYHITILQWPGKMLTPFELYFQPYQPNDSNSTVVGNGDDLLVDDTTDSISSVLRKEIEGKISTLKRFQFRC